VRVHSECLTGDVFGSQRCDCQAQLHKAMAMIGDEGRGIIVYLRQEGRGIGLIDKLRAYALQDEGLDTVQANERLGLPVDKRDYGTGAQILADLGVKELRTLTNNPKKYFGLAGYGLKVVEQVPLMIPPTPQNERYLRAKRDKLGHLLSALDPDAGPPVGGVRPLALPLPPAPLLPFPDTRQAIARHPVPENRVHPFGDRAPRAGHLPAPSRASAP